MQKLAYRIIAKATQTDNLRGFFFFALLNNLYFSLSEQATKVKKREFDISPMLVRSCHFCEGGEDEEYRKECRSLVRNYTS
ncbi:hypothetical protein [Prevotella intermedia]|uniref:Uncharacterized protein n=1 Tax=Prevotella intermedia TaxID=28131 RepID=A0A2A6EFL0_PREIN|nr:hypothetical protein [Prevotella intermedia]PDP60325.1 hypothetical protein CLI71_06215 [Prevotella intermedia]